MGCETWRKEKDSGLSFCLCKSLGGIGRGMMFIVAFTSSPCTLLSSSVMLLCTSGFLSLPCTLFFWNRWYFLSASWNRSLHWFMNNLPLKLLCKLCAKVPFHLQTLQVLSKGIKSLSPFLRWDKWNEEVTQLLQCHKVKTWTAPCVNGVSN